MQQHYRRRVIVARPNCIRIAVESKFVIELKSNSRCNHALLPECDGAAYVCWQVMMAQSNDSTPVNDSVPEDELMTEQRAESILAVYVMPVIMSRHHVTSCHAGHHCSGNGRQLDVAGRTTASTHASHVRLLVPRCPGAG